MHLTSIEALIAIILGTGGIGRGGWGIVAAIVRRAAAIEGFRKDVRDNLPKLVEATNALAQLALRHDDQLADHGRRLDDHDRQLDDLRGRQPAAAPTLPPPARVHLP